MPKLGEDAETRLTIAALAVALVKGAEETLPGLCLDFVQELDALQNQMRYWESEPTGTMETLRWARELIHERAVGA